MLLPTIILFLVLVTESILKIGYSQVTGLVYDLSQKFSKNDMVVKQKKLKRNILEVKAELASTSSQDEFAKWAKLRRKLDKSMADMEQLNSDISSSKVAFELKTKSMLWFLVHGSQFVLVLWFRKSAVFYLPPGWFGPARHFLSLPFSPKGSVSVAVWFASCRRMFKILSSVASDFIRREIREKKAPAPGPAMAT